MKTKEVNYTLDGYIDDDGYVWDLSDTFLTTYPNHTPDIFIYHDLDEASALKKALSETGNDAEEAIKKVYGDKAKEVRAFEVYDEDDNYIGTNYMF